MPSAQYVKIVDFLARHLHRLRHQDGQGGALNFPEFDLMPFDYLDFAEQELGRGTQVSRINCIGHLKRAVECELDTLLGVLGVGKCVTNFPRKLEFAKDVGIISPRSLAKLNQMRNRMEHQYATPEFGELEVYFDLVSGFVHTLEGYLFMFASNQAMNWETESGDPTASLGAEIKTRAPSVHFDLAETGQRTSIALESSTFVEYCDGLKIYFLLCRGIQLLSHDYVLAKLEDKPIHA